MLENRLEQILQRFMEVETQLSDPSVVSRPDDYRNYSREHAQLAPLVDKYREYRRVLDELRGAEELKASSDPELRAIAAVEHEELLTRKTAIESELRILLIPPDPHDDKNIIIEIRAGTGGDEAALFAGDLFRMYTRYAESRGFKIDIVDASPTGLGGFKEVIFGVSGTKVWRYYKYERGTHRVQRVPETEAQGRIHTSAVTVAVLPEAEDVEVEVRTEDLRIDTYRASGAGGQYINKTESAIRITHIPTGIVVACQDQRSQLKNKEKAMKVIRAKVYEQKVLEQEQATMSDRRQQVGSGDRSEKVRTYNFPQNRITDHRIDFSVYRLKDILDGDLDELIRKLIHADHEERLASAGE